MSVFGSNTKMSQIWKAAKLESFGLFLDSCQLLPTYSIFYLLYFLFHRLRKMDCYETLSPDTSFATFDISQACQFTH